MTSMEKEIFEQPKILSALAGVNEMTINNLVSDIKHRDIRLVYFAARGTSDNAAMYASYLLSTVVGIPTSLALPSVVTAYNGKLNLKDALVIGVSQSGKAADVLAVLERAKQNGALTVAVTNDTMSPLAQFADYHLYCSAGYEASVAATKTFTSQMFLLAQLTAVWSGSSELGAALERVPEAVENELNYLPEQIEKIAGRYSALESGFVLSRGFNMAVAYEMMLKMQEACYVKMKGYAVSDFWHGPVAQVNRGAFAVLMSPKGAVFEDCRDALRKLDEIGADTIFVTDDEAAASGRRFSFVLPDLGTDMCSPFLFAVFAQLFALKLSEVKGLDPDEPRNLKKITITR